MNFRASPAVLVALALVFPVGGVVGCQALTSLLRTPSVPDALGQLAQGVLACVPADDSPGPDAAAECLDAAVGAAGALLGSGADVLSCADAIRAAEAGDELARSRAAEILGELQSAIERAD